MPYWHSGAPLLGYGLRWAFPIGGLLLALLILALVIVAIVALVRASRRGAPRSESLEILKARYARGEISKDEFDEMRRTLSS
jgi:putative membrane protein